MCGVIGVCLLNPSEKDFSLARNLFVQSKIRGQHAAGIAYIQDGRVIIEKEPIPANAFIEKFDFTKCIRNNELLFIGHARYSTSNLLYNQPIGDEELAIVHNGVIDQNSPSTWKATWGYDCQTENDSELIFHCCKNGEYPLKKFDHGSLSVIELRSDGGIHAYRNRWRPLWSAFCSDGQIIASTKDILIRSLNTDDREWKISKFEAHDDMQPEAVDFVTKYGRK